MSTTNGWNNQVADAKTDVTLNAGTNTINISTDASSNAVNVGTGAAAKTVIVGSTNGASASTLQSGSGALNVTATNGALTINSGTGNLGISTDASATTVNIATGAAAKVTTLGSTNGASSLALKYGTADFSLASATGNVMVAQDTGEINYPLQPAFLAYFSTSALNVTGDGTTYTLAFNAEIFDQNSDFDTATGIFTAPVSGKYQLNIGILWGGLAAGNTTGFVTVTTSNRIYVAVNFNPGVIRITDQLQYSFALLADMDAGDTAFVVTQITGGAKVVDIVSPGATDPRTWFSGYLIC